MGVTELVMGIKNNSGVVVPLAVDLVVIVSAAYFGGQAITRLENVERAVTSMSTMNTRVSVLENSQQHINKQLDNLDSKLDRVLERLER